VPPRIVEPRGSSRVLGRIFGEAYHEPIPGAEVTLWCPTWQVFRIVETDLNGDFFIADLPGADDFELICWAPAFGAAHIRFSLLPFSELEVNASLTMGGEYTGFPGRPVTDRKVAGGRTVIVNDPKTGEPRPHFF